MSAPPEQPKRPRPLARWAAPVAWGVAAIVVALAAAVLLVARVGPLTEIGRRVVEAELNGLRVGGYGVLHVEGLDGDIWKDVSVRRLTLSDARGTWLDVRSLRVRWDWPSLFDRRLQVDELTAGLVTVAHAPVTAAGPRGGGPSPISVVVDRFVARVELLPAFSQRYGLYDAEGALDLERDGAAAGRLQATSLTHVGDRLDAAVDLGRGRTIALRLDGREAKGGAMAGALGLPADQPFSVSARASGTTSQGQFTLSSRSGASSPATASGAWTPQGGEASGRIALAASRRLAGYQSMLGPEVRFQIGGARAPDGFDAIALTATSDNLDLTARGEANLARRAVGPAGMSVSLNARQLNRIVGWPTMGAARFTGALTTGPKRWALAGQIAADAPNALDYRLASVAGPARLDWRGGEFDLQLTLDGAGGAGTGVVAALLGARPHGATELVWLTDGRLLAKSIAVEGPGLKVTGAGQRGLFGDLSFKGAANFSNFAAARAGANGVLTADWSAAQAGAAPWRLSFDANAHGFASGIVEVDHLLGTSPALKGDAVWDGHAFQVSAADLTGAAGSANATGAIGGDGALDLKLGWRAKGPLDLGPLEIGGAAEGDGALGGTIGAPRLDLAANLDSITLPQLTLTKAHVTLSFLKGASDTDGAFTLAASSPYGPASANTGFRLVSDGVELTGLTAEAGGAHALGSIALLRGAPSSADLSVSIGPGAFLSRGEASGRLGVTEAAGGAHASLRLTASAAATTSGGLIIQKGLLTAEGPLAHLPYRLEASGFTPHGSWRADGTGEIQEAAGDYGATFQGAGQLRGVDFKTLAPVVLHVGQHERLLTAEAEVGGGHARIDARQEGDSVKANAELTGVALGLVDQDLIGQFDATLEVAGQGDRLSGDMQAKLTNAAERDAKPDTALDGIIRAELGSGVVTLDAQLSNKQGMSSHAHLSAPAQSSAAPFRFALLRNAPLHGDFQADGEVRPLWALLMGGERTLAGQVHAQGTLSGTLADPEARGAATIANGAFSDSETGLKLSNVSLSAQLEPNAVDVSQFAGQDGASGQISGSGRVSLEPAGASSFRLSLNHFRLIDNDLATAVASGQATISRAADGAVKLTGALTVDRADIAANPPVPSGVTPMDVVEINRQPGVGGHLQASGVHAPAVGLDVSLKAPRAIFLKGRGLNAEFSLDSHVGGTTAGPVLTGAARVVRGDYDFAGKRFAFDTSGVIQLATAADDIRLDLTATREDPSLTAVIRIDGTAASPRITLSSTPMLPSDEVLAQVLFGTSTAQLSPLDAATVASAATTLAGGAGFDVAGNLGAFAHLDRLALGGDTAGAIVSGGKYVTSNIYVEVGGGANGPTGSVEWRVQKTLSVISRLAGGGGDSQVEVRWRKDY